MLRNVKRSTATQLLFYAKKYYYVLTEEKIQDILILSNAKRIHIMKALSSLSKFLGISDRWKSIIERYSLRWSVNDSLLTFSKIMNPDGNMNEMIKWIKEARRKLPPEYGNLLIYATLVGLRPNEACESFKLMREDKDNYLDKEKLVLQHYKYLPLFIRRTKKAYISIVNEKIMDLAHSCSSYNSPAKRLTYSALRSYMLRNNLKMNFYYCRKVFATFLRQEGIETEVIDLLQGRISNSTFVRHYYRPDLDVVFERVRKAVSRLHDFIANDGVLNS